jgi:hypothetical protein
MHHRLPVPHPFGAADRGLFIEPAGVTLGSNHSSRYVGYFTTVLECQKAAPKTRVPMHWRSPVPRKAPKPFGCFSLQRKRSSL